MRFALFKTLDAYLIDSLSKANRMVINQYMYWSLLLSNFGPHTFGTLRIGKIGLIEVYMFEVNVSREDLDILDKLRLEVAADIYDDKVNTSGQVSPYELLR